MPVLLGDFSTMRNECDLGWRLGSVGLEQLDQGQPRAGWWRDCVLDLPLDDVSATRLRKALSTSDQLALDAGIPESVLTVIQERGLYGRSNA